MKPAALAFLAVCFAADIGLSACDQNQTAQRLLHVGPGPNDPPTSAEMFQVMQASWQPSADSGQAGLLQLTGVDQTGQAITVPNSLWYGGATIYSTAATFTFKVLAPVQYRCVEQNPDIDRSSPPPIYFAPLSAQPEALSIAQPGQSVSCVGPIHFSKVGEGWLFSLSPYGGNAWVIKRPPAS